MQKEKKKRDSCQICLKKFGVFSGQHKCKRCLRTVCKDCADKKGLIYNTNDTKKQQHRICNQCWNDVNYIKTYVKENQISFNTLSNKGKQWFSLINDFEKQQEGQINQNDKVKKQASLNSNNNKHYSLTKGISKQVWKKINFSLRQMIGDSAVKFPNFLQFAEQLYQKVILEITNLNEPIHTHIKSQKDLLMIILYTLAHGHQIAALKISVYLIKIQKQFKIQRVFQNLQILQKDNQRLKKLSSYAKNTSKQFINNFGFEHLRSQVINQIISQTIINNSIQAFEAAYAYLIWFNREIILNGALDDNQVLRQILLKTDQKNIQKGLKLIRSQKVIVRNSLNLNLNQQGVKNDKKEPSSLSNQKNQSGFQKKPKNQVKVEQTFKMKLQAGEQKQESQKYQGKFLKRYRQSKNIQTISNSQKQKQYLNSMMTNISDDMLQQDQLGDSGQVQVQKFLNGALKFIQNMQSGKMTKSLQGKLNAKDFDQLDKYLDMIIDQNDKGLQECQQLQGMLSQIQTKFNLVNIQKEQ